MRPRFRPCARLPRAGDLPRAAHPLAPLFWPASRRALLAGSWTFLQHLPGFNRHQGCLSSADPSASRSLLQVARSWRSRQFLRATQPLCGAPQLYDAHYEEKERREHLASPLASPCPAQKTFIQAPV